MIMSSANITVQVQVVSTKHARTNYIHVWHSTVLMLTIQIMIKFFQKHVTKQARSHAAGVSLRINISGNKFSS